MDVVLVGVTAYGDCNRHFAQWGDFMLRGTTPDGSKLLLWSLKAVTKLGPATERSAPESGSAVSFADPLRDKKWAWIVGAGMTLGSRDAKDLVCRRRMLTAFAEASVGGSGSVSVGLRDLQTFAKCPVWLYVWHVT